MRSAASVVVAFRLIMGVLAVVYFGLAIAILAMRYVVLPNIDDYRDDIESLASRALGAQVRVDAIDANWYRLNPQLRLTGARVLTPSGDVALSLPRVDALLSWRSLLSLRPEVLRLQLIRPFLDVWRDVNGDLWVAGLPVARDDDGDRSFDENPVLQWALRQRSIEVFDATVHWRDDTAELPGIRLDGVHGVLRHKVLGGTRFALQAPQVHGVSGKIDVRGEVRRVLFGLPFPAEGAGLAGRLYVSLDDVDVAGVRRWAGSLVPAAHGRMAGRLWVDFSRDHPTSWLGDVALRDAAIAPRDSVPGVSARSMVARLSGDAVAGTTRADLALSDGVFSAPEIFEATDVPVHTFSTLATFAYPPGGSPSLNVERLRLDAGEPGARAVLHVAGGWRSEPGSELGRVDLAGRLLRADAGAIVRFMPAFVDEDVRDWLKRGLVGGTVANAELRLAGRLDDFPFDETPAEAGEFRVAGEVRQVGINLVPDADPAWPRLDGLNGLVSIDRASLTADIVSGYIDVGEPNPLALGATRVSIPSLSDESILTVEGGVAGTANGFLAYARRSPVGGFTDDVLAKASATGNWQMSLKVVAPLADIDRIEVDGELRFNRNALRFEPGAPVFRELAGTVVFSEESVSAREVRARFLGGPFLASGRTHAGGGGDVEFSGRMNAANWRELWDAPGMRRASGEADYKGKLKVHSRGGASFEVESALEGVALDLPAPFAKPASARWPLRMALDDPGDNASGYPTLSASLNEASRLALEFEHTGPDETPRVRRAALGVQRTAELPERGVRVRIQTPSLNLDAWESVADEFIAGQDKRPGARSAKSVRVVQPAGAAPADISLAAGELVALGREFSKVRLDASRTGGAGWRIVVDSTQVAGDFSWRPQGAGVVARLDGHFRKLVLPQLDNDEPPDEIREVFSANDPADVRAIPDVDVKVDDFRYGDWALGELRVRAGHDSNLQRWTVHQFVLDNADARLEATGAWVPEPARTGDRRMSFDASWKVRDAGQLLARFGMPGVLSGGHGDIKGKVSWTGEPFSYDLPSLSGSFGIALDSGRFLPVSSGAGRLLGILSLQSLARIATFQGGDLFAKGFAWDTLRSEIAVEAGHAQVNAFELKGQSAVAVLSGTVDLMAETQDLRAVIVPKIDASGAALLAGLAINPVVGVGAFLTQWLLRHPLSQALTYEYGISGSWSNPRVDRIREPARVQNDDLPY